MESRCGNLFESIIVVKLINWDVSVLLKAVQEEKKFG